MKGMSWLACRLRSILILDRWCSAAFAVSLMLGLAGLAIAGRMVARVNQFDEFVRFYPRVLPSSYYYPTASQSVEIARAHRRPDQVLVIVGGSSVLYGAGQGSAEVWTLALQRALGERFAVVNLALPS